MVTEIKNYKLKDFLKQPTELIFDYINVLKHLKPIDTNNEVWYLSLKEVEFIKENVGITNDESIIEIIGIVQGYEDIKLPKWLKMILPKRIESYINNSKKRKVLNLRIIEFFGLLNSVKEQLEQINNAELSSLVSSNPNMKWELVNGSDRLKRFGIYNALENLSDGDILKWDKIRELQYSEVFTKLLMNKVNSDLHHEMQNIKTTNNV